MYGVGAIYGEYGDPQIVYVDKFITIEKYVGGGGGGTTRVVEYKERPFPKMKIRRQDVKNTRLIRIRLLRMHHEDAK